MALLAMAVYSTEENKKDECLRATLMSLKDTVDFRKHRLILSVNAFTAATKYILEANSGIIEGVIWNGKNLGTANAINKVWYDRRPEENAIKMDDDVYIHQAGWVDDMEEALRREPKIGQCGLKRKDCWEEPSRTDFYKSELIMLPHKPGERWLVAEKVNHVMGTCQMYSSALLDKIGYLYQPGLYGFDDALASARSQLAGFINVFLPYIEIEHIDEGKTPYQGWKERSSGADMAAYNKTLADYNSGRLSIYHNPFKQ